jgi:hypothetical protein
MFELNAAMWSKFSSRADIAIREGVKTRLKSRRSIS